MLPSTIPYIDNNPDIEVESMTIAYNQRLRTRLVTFKAGLRESDKGVNRRQRRRRMGLGAANRTPGFSGISRLCRRGSVIGSQGIELPNPGHYQYLKKIAGSLFYPG